MEYLVGVSLGLGVPVFGRMSGLDRDRAFYPVVLIVIASYYILFAVMSGALEAILLETLVFLLFVIAAVVGFKRNLWIVVVALVFHGAQDFFHIEVIANPGVPAWWPMFCGTFDVVAGACLAYFLQRGAGSSLKA